MSSTGKKEISILSIIYHMIQRQNKIFNRKMKIYSAGILGAVVLVLLIYMNLGAEVYYLKISGQESGYNEINKCSQRRLRRYLKSCPNHQEGLQ